MTPSPSQVKCPHELDFQLSIVFFLTLCFSSYFEFWIFDTTVTDTGNLWIRCYTYTCMKNIIIVQTFLVDFKNVNTKTFVFDVIDYIAFTFLKILVLTLTPGTEMIDAKILILLIGATGAPTNVPQMSSTRAPIHVSSQSTTMSISSILFRWGRRSSRQLRLSEAGNSRTKPLRGNYKCQSISSNQLEA